MRNDLVNRERFWRPTALASLALVLFLAACGVPAQAPTAAPAAPTAGVTAAAVVPAPTAAAKTPKPAAILILKKRA